MYCWTIRNGSSFVIMSNNTSTTEVVSYEDMKATGKKHDLPIGTIINYNGTMLEVKKDTNRRCCTGCYFYREKNGGMCYEPTLRSDSPLICLRSNRADYTPVIFAEKKGGVE